MKKALLLLLVAASVCFANTKAVDSTLFLNLDLKAYIEKNLYLDNMSLTSQVQTNYCRIQNTPLNEIKKMLYRYAGKLNQPVITTVLTAIKCSRESNLRYNRFLTIIDYSVPSNQKRLWVFDLAKRKLLFNTYVSHGITSGSLVTDYFSDDVNSKASSIGVFNTDKAYRGRHGLSLKLIGLDRNINGRAYQRNIVMHAAWYVEAGFIKKYGRVGRSWGCPAVPENLTKAIIDTIQNQSLLIVYYPSFSWVTKSKYLNCDANSISLNSENVRFMSTVAEDSNRERIPYLDINNDNTFEDSEPVLVISADNYQSVFNTKPPLDRMLRRQINGMEYIALDNAELLRLDSNYDGSITVDDIYGLKALNLVVPVVIIHRGSYVGTEFKFVYPGKITKIVLNQNPEIKLITTLDPSPVIYLSDKAINLRSTDRFIRWLGL